MTEIGKMCVFGLQLDVCAKQIYQTIWHYQKRFG